MMLLRNVGQDLRFVLRQLPRIAAVEPAHVFRNK